MNKTIIPANFWQVGKPIKIKAQGTYTPSVPTPVTAMLPCGCYAVVDSDLDTIEAFRCFEHGADL